VGYIFVVVASACYGAWSGGERGTKHGNLRWKWWGASQRKEVGSKCGMCPDMRSRRELEDEGRRIIT
jgi:hypothetical protein